MTDSNYSSEDAYSTLPKEYWPCPLCIVTLLNAHSQGIIDHPAAYAALQNSGLVELWPEVEGRVRTTAKGNKFVEMLLDVPLPVQEWIDPRALEQRSK
jgi:hypothetical protein